MKITEKKPTLRDIETITPYPLNAKKHEDEQVTRLAESIRRFGWRGNPIIVDKEGVIIAGHGRRLAAIKLGIKQVPVIVEDDMTAEEARAFRLADNRAAISDIDNDLLQEELLDLGDVSDLLDGIFDKKELDFAVADLFQINDSSFVSDLSTVMDETNQTTTQKIEQNDSKQISIAKVMGFKSINGSDSIYVSRLMAQIEANTGLEGADAFVAFAKQLVE